MNRRTFIQQSSLAGLSLAIPSPKIIQGETNKKITILHTNDQHSRIEPFEISESRNSGKGGFARRATLVENIRRQEKNVLLLDAGDIFQGTPYFNYFGGEVEFKLMSHLKYDASTMGNHDFDNGLEGFNQQLPHAKFPFIISNYDFSNTLLEGKTKPYHLFKFEGIKVGVFGLGIELEGLVSKQMYKETQYLNPIEITQQMTQFLKSKNCDLIICLSHLGYNYKDEKDKISDVKLAQQTQDIDLIIGGHTHTFLSNPQLYKNLLGKDVLINQVGWAGIMLGRIDFYFDPITREKSYASDNLIIDKNIV